MCLPVPKNTVLFQSWLDSPVFLSLPPSLPPSVSLHTAIVRSERQVLWGDWRSLAVSVGTVPISLLSLTESVFNLLLNFRE